MLTLHDSSPGMTRRQLLHAGSLAIGGLSMAPFFAARAADPSMASILTGKSVIFIFQQGGPSQFETFDPKPEAPTDIRTIGGVIPTSAPGVIFGSTMQQLSRLADKLTIVRSFQTGNAEHNIRPIVSADSLNANIGCLLSRVAGPTHPSTAMPTNAVLFPQSVRSDVVRGQGRGDMAATGAMGATYTPFVPGGANQLLNNLRLSMSPDRFQDRQALLTQFDRLREDFDAEPAVGDYHRNHRQAREAILSGRVAEALDLSREDPRVIDRYDTSRFAASDDWSSARRGARGYYTGHAKAFGKTLLLARRLCEAGCGFVTVHCDYEGVWDFHADGENLNTEDGMKAIGRSFDHAVAAFIQDLEARGLSDRILLVATGEMGRTPRINRNGGRDHWARLAPLLLYGGGMAVSDPFTSANLISTILHTALDVPRLRLQPALAAISRLAEARPIVT